MESRAWDNELLAFQEAMRLEKERELKEGIAHLKDVEVSELTDEDLRIWEKVCSGTLERSDLAEYEKTILDAQKRPLRNVPQSRVEFLAFIRNKATPIFLRQEMEAMEKFSSD
jgi:hypothetical protein